MCSTGVSKRMRSATLHRRVQRERAFCDDRPEGTSSEGLDGRLNRQKDFSIRRARAPFLEITDDGLADRGGERIRFSSFAPWCAGRKASPFPNPNLPVSVRALRRSAGRKRRGEAKWRGPEDPGPGSVGGGYQALHIVPGRTDGVDFRADKPVAMRPKRRVLVVHQPLLSAYRRKVRRPEA